ncbi:beta-glucosidase [Oculatella sp. LEGE 06141]|uniref:glycoside hydrolase family 3 N-terminal domain-containing protein n=1 Tax=Oculatella sp. LEGE 06141 TaxID=1828648 RepID=UPI00187E8D50|nr:glycoside hydrolase family 3 N-terminal domain-containing protein [Oculatella sp. LEGE 06141]MBE9182603.1 beta-glucosidase [Oculatella sp. LEGE 06141]
MAAFLPNLEDLTLKEQVAQMVVVRASGHLFNHQIEYPIWEPPAATLRHWLQDLGVGGVLLLGGTAAEVGLRSHQLQEWATIPLLVSADIEEGVGQRFAGATWFPPPMALGAIAQRDLDKAQACAEQMGRATAEEALAIGINWLLAPVVDVNNNPNNPVINVRSFGETPEGVSQLITAFIRGAAPYPVLTAAKHFPGHGNTAVDSHLHLPVLPHSLEQLAEVEFPPFRAAMAAGVDAVMTAHLQIPALDGDRPATLSHAILTRLLRQQLGFNGLIVTDALVMGAITDRFGAREAPVLAVEAGADVVLMPVDPVGAIDAVCQAVETGRIAPEQIQASVERIWQAKQKVYAPAIKGDTSHAWENLPPPPIQLDHLARPEAIATAQTIVQDSMQARVPHPVQPSAAARNVIVVDELLACRFLQPQSPAIALPRRMGYQLQLVDRYTATVLPDPTAEGLAPTLLQLFIRGNPFRDPTGLIKLAKTWFQSLLTSQDLQALIIYGSPYVLEQFLPELPSHIPYLFTYGQMDTAQAIALKTLFAEPRSLNAPVLAGNQPFTD